MRPRFLIGSVLSLLLPLSAQNVDVLGGTNSPATTGKAKANIIRVDTTIFVLNFEVYLTITGAETLTFFVYRCNSQLGSYKLEWTKQVPVTGTGAGVWYSPGPIPQMLVAGNHYAIGVAFLGTPTYYYKTATSGQPFTFGAWYSGRTPTNPPLQNPLSIGGVDVAQYYQRITSIPTPSVMPIGTGCGASPVPRLVAASTATIGNTFALELVSGPSSGNTLYVLGTGGTLATPITLLGCPFWVDLLAGPSVNVGVPTDASGNATLSIPIPNNPLLSGQRFSSQNAFLSGAGLALTNAVEFVL